ncbi:efflux RND transporter periplasmic adaptor subunit [Candidatus Dependentiae bacterium]|nr:efflux RND transporter periplasmic adaptor subunit [Candidatus Dependentiae bacterium]
MIRIIIIVLVFIFFCAGEKIFCVEGVIIPYREISISGGLSAVIKNMKITEGEFVSKNEVICELDIIKIYDELVQAEMDLDKMLLENKKLQKDRNLIEIKISNHNIMKKKFDVSKIKDKLKKAVVRSSVSGFVKEIKVKEGDQINEGGKIAGLTDISNVFLEINLPVGSGQKYKIGQEVKIEIPLIKKNIVGKIWTVFPEIDSATNTVKTRILIKNPNNEIKPGMLASIKE